MARIPGGAIMLILTPRPSVQYLGNSTRARSLSRTIQRVGCWLRVSSHVRRNLGNMIGKCSLSFLAIGGGRHA
jgi:hypothetical protein